MRALLFFLCVIVGISGNSQSVKKVKVADLGDATVETLRAKLGFTIDDIEKWNAAAGANETYDFGTEGTYFVSSSTGSDLNNGTSVLSPKRTIAAVTALNPTAGSKIALKAGDTFYETLTPSTSGSSGNVITYGAYGVGEKPTISGLKKLEGWKQYSGNIWRCWVPQNPTMVFADGIYIPIARYPDTGYFKVTSASGGTSVTSTSLSTSITSYNDATLYYKKDEWTINSVSVTATSSQTLTTSALPYSASYTVDWGFWLVNKVDFLSLYPTLTRWAYNPTDGYLYILFSDGSNPNAKDMQYSYNKGIVVADKSYLKFENLKIYGSKQDGVTITTTAARYGLEFNKVDIDECGRDGIYAYGANVTGITVDSCSIKNTSATGFESYSPSTISITYSLFEDIGLMNHIGLSPRPYGQIGSGITLANPSNICEIAYNRIINTGYCGVNAHKCKVHHNFIKNPLTVIDDGAGIYLTGGVGSRAYYNIILDCTGTTGGESGSGELHAHGIYFDGGISNQAAFNNVINNSSWTGVFLNLNTANDSIHNNLINDCLTGFRAAGTLAANGNMFYNNTVCKGKYLNYGQGLNSIIIQVNYPADYGLIDNNIYYNYNNGAYFQSTPTSWTNSLSTWSTTTGKDTNSVLYSNTLGNTELFYNDTFEDKKINLVGTYYNIDGTSITSFILQPFTGKVVLNAN